MQMKALSISHISGSEHITWTHHVTHHNSRPGRSTTVWTVTHTSALSTSELPHHTSLILNLSILNDVTMILMIGYIYLYVHAFPVANVFTSEAESKLTANCITQQSYQYLVFRALMREMQFVSRVPVSPSSSSNCRINKCFVFFTA